MFKRTIAFLATLVLFSALFAVAQPQNTSRPKRIMVFGDSNTWSYQPFAVTTADYQPRPVMTPSSRYAPDVRWTGVLAKALGADYEIIEEGLNCRTTDLDNPDCGLSGASFNGAAYLPAVISSQMPLDLVVIMLGTEDTCPSFDRSTQEIAKAILKLANIVKTTTGAISAYPAAKVLVVSPVPLGHISPSWFGIFDLSSVDKSRALAGVLGSLAAAAKIPFFDAGRVIGAADGSDGIHWSPESHRKLGQALMQPVKDALK
jgi:lysophospholipase L1-like esterase